MAEIHKYECPSCGGVMEFDIATQKIKCPYCGTVLAVEEYEENASESQETKSNQEWFGEETEGMRVYSCQSCGAEIVAEETTGASFCPYCGNNIMVENQFSGDLKPNAVIPFQMDKKAAKAAYENHIKGKHFLPKLFKNQNHIDKIQGIYVPFWLYDVDVHAESSFTGEKTRRYDEGDQYREVHEVYEIQRGGSLSFQRIPADGSKKMDDALMESIEPYDASKAVPFSKAYLAGYLADRYDTDAEERKKRMEQRVKSSAEACLKNTVQGYNSLSTDSSEIEVEKCTSEYVLLPVWLLNTTWNGKQFTFAMNGQTGKMVGNLPVDHKAFWLWTVLLTVLFTGGIYGFFALMMSLA